MRCRPTLIGPFSTPELEDRGHVANRIFYVPRFHYFAVVFRIATIFAHEGLKYRTSGVTATSRTPPWLPSGWGCRDRHLSTTRENPGTRCGSSLFHPGARRRGPDRGGPARPPGFLCDATGDQSPS